MSDYDPLVDLSGAPKHVAEMPYDRERLESYRAACEREIREALGGGPDLGHRLIAAAGIPEQLRGWSLTRVEACPVVDADGARRWFKNMQTAAASSGRKRLALMPWVAPHFTRVRRWAERPAGWLWIEGSVGAGKSTLAAAIACDLMATSDVEVTWEEPDEAYEATCKRRHGDEWWYWSRRSMPPRTQRKAARAVVWLDEHELMARVRAGWKGDPAPLYQVSNAAILFLDDLGVSRSWDGGVNEQVAMAIERLVCYRYDHKLPTVVTTNVAAADVRGVYGDRTASRLREVVGSPIHIDGQDLRGIA